MEDYLFPLSRELEGHSSPSAKRLGKNEEERMEKRLGFVGVIIHNRKKTAPLVNDCLTEFGDLIIGRMGIPHVKRELSVIVLIVNTTTNELGSLTGKLGKISGVSVKSGLSKAE
jgi:putative iron-only hydrogenase system regulator